jgi:hypothetical protein
MNPRKRSDPSVDRDDRDGGDRLLRPPVWFVVVVAACTVVIAATFF